MSALVFLLALTSADCAGCHPHEAAAFATSRHAGASRQAIFAVSARVARTGWCATCHQPAADADGLVCLSCHDADHAAPADAALGRDACARCHEFRTPLPDHLDPVVYSAQPLQSTVSELGDAKTRCTSCHDPHAPTGAHDPARLRGALAIEAARTDAGVEVRLTARGTGHRVPTGDPFRRVVVSVCDDAACTHVLERQTIGRAFALVAGVWAPVVDHRLRDGETRVLRFGPARAWRADFFYGDPALESKLPAEDVSIELGAGTF